MPHMIDPKYETSDPVCAALLEALAATDKAIQHGDHRDRTLKAYDTLIRLLATDFADYAEA